MDVVTSVLLIEDSPEFAYAMRKSIGKVTSGLIQIAFAQRLDEALSCLSERHFDAILLDLGLPDSCGLETFRKVHAHSPALPIVILSGDDDEQHAIQSVKEGAQDWVLKEDVNPRLITRAIQHAMERKRAEQELRLDGEIIANMAEGVYLVRTSDGVIVRANPRFEEMFAYGPGELIGQHVSIVNAPTNKAPEETASEIMQALREDGVWVGEIQNVKKDGTLFWCRASVTTFEHADYGTVWLSIHQDISERKQAEEALRASEDRYRGLYESIKDGIVRVDMQGAILEHNQAYADMLGYAPEEVKHLTYQQITPPKWHEMEADIVARQIVARGYSDAYEKEYVRKDGTVFPVALRVWLIVDRVGRHQGMWAIVRDISKRKQAEAEREQLIVELRAVIDKARVLSGLIPICASCKKIRDDNGYLQQLELYISQHSDADFSHGICPECLKKLYPAYAS